MNNLEKAIIYLELLVDELDMDNMCALCDIKKAKKILEKIQFN